MMVLKRINTREIVQYKPDESVLPPPKKCVKKR